MKIGTSAMKKYVKINGKWDWNPDFQVARRQETEIHRQGSSGARLGGCANRMRVFPTPAPRPSSPSSVREFESIDYSVIKKCESLTSDPPVEVVPAGCVCDIFSLSDLTDEESQNSWPSDEEHSVSVSISPPPRLRRIAQSNNWSSDEGDRVFTPLSTPPRARQTTRSDTNLLRRAQLDRMPTAPSDSNTPNAERLTVAQLDRVPIAYAVLGVPRKKPSKMGKNLWFRFSGSHNMGHFITKDFRRTGNDEMNHCSLRGRERFNDIQFYEGLLQEKDCIRVDICKLCVYRTSRGISRFYVHYRLTFFDGSTEEREGPNHFFYSPQENEELPELWILEDTEFLLGVTINQDEIVRGVTFKTNLQDIKCGESGGHAYDAIAANPPSMRIVAFCGSVFEGHFERLGFYSMSFGWHLCGSFILVRELFRRGRAIAPTEESIKHRIRKQMLLGFFNREAGVIRRPYFRNLIEELAHLDDDTFLELIGSYDALLVADATFRSLMNTLFREDDGIFRNIMSYIGG